MVRVEGHQRAFFHREADGLDTGAQHRLRLSEALECFRHAEFALPAAHPGDVGGGDDC
ncbi:hypothetical protein ACIA8E_29505 [Streptomyces sp. NPDC051664]|uniref:hypothetical protein n=1 Tax=Streptomyces sp. NPDC051664 TaxID=3365668 RepID=UPI00379131E8